MIDDLVNNIAHEDQKSAAIPDSAAKGESRPAVPSGERRARADDNGSWNAAMSEGWPSSPPASPPPSHHADQAPGDVRCSHAPAAER